MHMTADREIWVATALLHCENPGRRDFTVAEIVARAVAERPASGFRSILAECAICEGVANFAPDTVHSCVLTATAPDRRRLFREGDERHAGRSNGKNFTRDLPERYQFLVDWYNTVYQRWPVQRSFQVRYARGVA